MGKNDANKSSLENNNYDDRLAMAKQCSHEGVIAGAKAAVIAGVVSAIPTVAIARKLPWGKANLNPTAQALIVSTVAGAAYFIVADKTVLKSARRNSYHQAEMHNIGA
ncbi:hypothetical protein vseg_000082 [Gypsophila vaccaria]